MLSAFPTNSIMQDFRLKLCILAFFAFLCAVAGAAFAVNADHSYMLLMRMAASCRVSIVGAAITVLPYLVSFYILIHSKPWLVYCVCGVALFLLSAALMSIRITYGSAGWLISVLLLLPQLVLTPMLFYLAIIKLRRQSISLPWVSLIAVCSLIGMIDYALVSPFLAKLINTYETMGRYAIHVGLDRCL
ncbi:MAG: hypothetical protein E7447_06545 [Ruminococcaceae bacterium]|nr:hypothetical protein [Oscillospiraceae bacterium]